MIQVLPSKKYAILILTAGMAALFVVMGIGRFAYTPILPLMVEATHLNNETAGYLASSNYFGYLVGALLAGKMAWKKGKAYYAYFHLILNIASTFLMGVVVNELIWHLLRFLSGVTSGIVFVLVSSIVIDYLVSAGHASWTGYLFGGVGLGIFSTGLLVPLLSISFDWAGIWIALGILSTILGLFTWKRLSEAPEKESIEIKNAENNLVQSKTKTILPWLCAAYGLEGIGYIISGTYLVAFAAEIPMLQSNPSLSWVLVGAAAAPSCVIWSGVASKIGNLAALQAAFFLQISGVLFPVIFFNGFGALVGSFLFGATFMGIVTLTMAEARNAAAGQSNNIIGGFTFIYSLGQMIGPIAAGLLISATAALSSSFYFAGAVLLTGMGCLGIAQGLQKNR
ncbi:YbfB/YjiJ family MFS transporter [Alteribacillus bidgolensis]|uniref:Predicted arabinose efflux permease, MFS family n=1 Tax=Alteribacillus bidgolensis TaxID=930129 RepID=A0A1G8ILD3_9BACI|nr:YbfB/YjiJ family MFS transporter [Alteribacillus bidgolensis]SDI19756.1 Predicted arabinose efflux permease, MFS family [Alteribacillus bidgolensis]